MNITQVRTQLNMSYVTISYKQSDTARVQPIFTHISQWFTEEVSTKKYLWSVQGLISCSFEYQNGITFDQIKEIFNSKIHRIFDMI